jgi:hypothetical protein
MKKHAPAALRNREAILAVLRQELPEGGTVLEVASGSGEHVVHFAEQMPHLAWQPSDPDPEAVASIEAYRADYSGVNLRPALMLDASAPDSWNLAQADAVLCINMVHISPWSASEGLFAGAQRVLAASGGPLVLYGAYIEEGVEIAPSNIEFDASLKARNPLWGLRSLGAMDELARAHGFVRTARHAMPANNLTLVYRAVD